MTFDPFHLKTPSGDEMVILTLAEYNALLDAAAEAEEDEADAAIYAQRKAELAQNPEAVFPPEVSASINAGSGRLAAVRIWRGRSVAEIAKIAGIAESYLSSIEAGHAPLSDEMATELAAALDVPASWFAP